MTWTSFYYDSWLHATWQSDGLRYIDLTSSSTHIAAAAVVRLQFIVAKLTDCCKWVLDLANIYRPAVVGIRPTSVCYFVWDRGLDTFIWQSFSGQFRNKIMELVWKGHSDSAINGKHVLSVQPGPRARQLTDYRRRREQAIVCTSAQSLRECTARARAYL